MEDEENVTKITSKSSKTGALDEYLRYTGRTESPTNK